ncbi:ATP-binding cassette domain-containing protein [Fulvivirga sp. M361]|uniref:cell division ATP-binding protein FtsE n=1 Tax=Fulvivirga sp. M361 TaxID=2594266 RepID=UPI00117A51DF|nr:ATP-binding cassette domain-containing protein [Fulvivirga sp. M361]TRX62065.1 ATP-binding cassette domain-containing protein [Fulvivirga sp. M361]
MSFSSGPVISVQKASIFQEDIAVLNNVNFDIEKGEFVFLVGRTGGGKSSLLKTIYADLPFRSGQMQVAGYNIGKIQASEVPMLRRKVGIIFQDFQLFPDRTVAENLNFVLKATGWKDSAKIKARQAEVLMQVGLGSAGPKLPHQLSGGEQQRVVIARALLNEPLILVADEPTGNLDPEVSTGIFKIFQDINKSGTAVLMATHDHSLVKNYGYRVLKCEKGKILDSKTASFSLNTESF